MLPLLLSSGSETIAQVIILHEQGKVRLRGCGVGLHRNTVQLRRTKTQVISSMI